MTNPWKAPPNSTEQGRQTPRRAAGPRPQHPDSVSGTLRISDMVAPRKIPPGSGWRKFLYGVSFHTINIGESPGERHYRELQGRIRRHIRKQYVVGVVSGKGGVGKTTMTACLGAVFRECRPENVVAIDAAPGFGTLAGRIDESPPGDYTAVLNDTDVQG
ncbi:MAG: MinD/ParA family ATP-binding protein, partial [Acidimicrobiales bacterium]